MLPKRLIFTILKSTDFLGSRDSNPYNLRHYDQTNFAMYVNGRQIPSESLSWNMDHEKTSVRGYAKLFEGTGIHHSNSGLQITHDMYTQQNANPRTHHCSLRRILLPLRSIHG